MRHSVIISQMTSGLVSEETQGRIYAAEAEVDVLFRDEKIEVKLAYMQAVLLAVILDGKMQNA